MSKLEELVQKYCPDGVEYARLGEIFQVQNGYTPSKSDNSFWDNGIIPWFRLEDIRTNGRVLKDAIQHVTPSAVKRGGLFKAGSIIISTTATIGEYALIECDFICNQQITCLTPLSKNINPHFYFHYAAIIGEWCKQNVNGAGLAIVPTSKLKDYKVPVPPLHIQEEIVRILDTFEGLQSGLIPSLQAELQKRLQQYNYYRDNIFQFEGRSDVQWKKLGEIASIKTGRRFVRTDIRESGVPCFHYGDIYTYYGLTATQTKGYLDEELAKKLRFAQPNDVVVVCAGENDMDIGVGVAWLGDEPAVVHDACCILHHNQNPRYISHFLRTHNYHLQIKKYVKNGKISSLPASGLAEALIPLPSLEEQEKIASILDRFDTLTNDLVAGLPAEIEKRRQQYEFYRDKLLTFKRKEA